MRAQPKIMNRCVAAAALPLLALSTLAQGAEPDRAAPYWESQPYAERVERERLMTRSGNSSAVIFAPGAEADPAWYTYQRQTAPEYNRLDEALAVGEPDPTAGWYNWPTPARPSLGDQERFYTSRSANVYTYPGRDGRSSYSSPYPYRFNARPYHRHRSYGRGPYLRRRVR